MRRALKMLSVRYVVTIVFLGFLSATPTSVAAEAATRQAAMIVQDFSDQVLQLVTVKDISDAEKRVRFQSLLNTYFDVPTIGRFVLGRYWRRASAAEKSRYLGVFAKITAHSFVSRFSEYDGQLPRFISASQIDDRYIIVKTEIFDPNGGSPPFQVNWRVVANKTPMKIMDVVIEGVSLSITQRAEYAGFIQQNGGRVANLISALEKKLAELK